MKNVIVLVALIHLCSALRNISDEDYASMPPIRHHDLFDICLAKPGGVYCTAKTGLSADGPNQLYEIMTNYSNISPRHLNYSNVVYGFCVTKRCRKYYEGNSEAQPEEAMQQCLDEYFQKEYGLRATVESVQCYKQGEELYERDYLDYFYLALVATLIILAIAGSVYDFAATNKNPKSFLMCFSLLTNWKVLTAPWPNDPKNSRLIGVNGMRTITSCLVIAVHAALPPLISLANTYNLETILEDKSLQTYIQAQIIMQTFFFFSGLFLTYTHLSYSEKRQPTWRNLPKAIFLRWLRLTPVQMFAVLTTMTWSRFAPKGPMWQSALGLEVRDCRSQWLSLFFMYNNYVDDSECALQNWSTATDMQLYTLGLTVMYLVPSTRRNAAFAFLFIIGLIIPGYITYANDLDGSFMVYARTFIETSVMIRDPTYKYWYKPGHTNIPNFVLGMATGIYVYNILKKPIDSSKYKKYSVFYWLLLPCMYYLQTSTSTLYLWEGGRPPMALRLLFSMFYKPIWGVLIALLVIGLVYDVERVPVYKLVLEWPGWVPLMRLTYCAYQIHVPLIKIFAGANGTLVHFSLLSLGITCSGFVAISFPVALIFWLLVEAPTSNLVRYVFPEKQSVIRDSKEHSK